MDRLFFGEGQTVLCVMCSDGRSRPPVEMASHPDLNFVRRPGGLLAPLVCTARDASPCPDVLATRRQDLVHEIALMVTLKRPEAMFIVTHTDCKAQSMLGLAHEEVQREANLLVTALRTQSVGIPIHVVHDDHCTRGIARVFREHAPHATVASAA